MTFATKLDDARFATRKGLTLLKKVTEMIVDPGAT